jgi:uncharacterized protein YdhG (YjbR/CyaY superfamily)
MINDYGTFEEALSKASSQARNLANGLRKLICQVMPAVVEVPWPRMRMASYGVGSKKQSEHFCYISAQKNDANLGFYYGAELPDPEELLQGSGKLLRHVKVREQKAIANPALRRLLRIASRHRMPTKPALSASKREAAGEQEERVQEYFATLPAKARRHLQKVREAIRKGAPKAVEAFGYGMPAFSLKGKPFIWYAAWKKHSGFYPISQATARELAAELKEYEISGKGTIRFPLDEPVPVALLKRLVKARVAELQKNE